MLDPEELAEDLYPHIPQGGPPFANEQEYRDFRIRMTGEILAREYADHLLLCK
jgi:hypothetical protein